LAPYEDLRAASLYRDPVRIAFDIRAGKYSICGNEFDPSRQPLEIKLGAVDEFVLSTLNAVKPRHHPFHMHVNPFQQIAVNNTPLAHPIWRDTVIVEKDQPVTVRMRPVTFTGESVIHCHILDHEDRGMMMKFRIVDGEPQPPGC
jgi:FtsP/CotA-like multicopper oxidase with cupredoxin domain